MGVDIKVLKQNVLDEAYKNLTNLYPGFAQFIAKYTISDINPDGSMAIGSFSVIISGKNLTIPIIYRDGSVDSTSYIGDDDSGRYYALTKTLYNKLINTISNALGTVVTQDDVKKNKGDNVTDQGIIGSLFATPMTFSPKIASLMSKKASVDVDYDSVVNGFRRVKFKKLGLVKEASYNSEDSILMDIAFNNKSFAKNLLKMASDEKISPILESVGVDKNELKNILESFRFTKIASEINTKPIVYFSYNELNGLSTKEKIEAIEKIATDGFYIKNSNKLTKIASNLDNVKSEIKNILLKKVQEVNSPGIWTVFDSNFNADTAIVARSYKEVHKFPESMNRSDMLFVSGDSITQINTKATGVVGIKKDNHIGMSFLDVLNIRLKPVLSNEKSYDNLIVANNKDIMYFRAYDLSEPVRIKDRIIFDISIPLADYNQIIIAPDNEISRIIINNGILYVPKSNAFFVKSSNIRKFVTIKDIEDDFFTKTASVVFRDDGKYMYGNSVLNSKQLVVKLANEGYNADSIKSIIKQAADNKNIETPLIALNNQTAQIMSQIQTQTLNTQQIMVLLAQIKQSIDNTNALLSQSMQPVQQIQDGGMQQYGSGSDDAQNVQQQSGSGDTQTPQPQQNQDELVNQISQYASMLGQDPQQLIQQAQAQGMSLEDLLTQLQNYAAQSQQAQAPQQDQQAQAPQDPNMSPDGMVGVGSGSGSASGNSDVQVDDNGFMQQNIDPEMLATLKELADKKVLESSIISYLSTLDTPQSTIQNYVEQIKDGVNGMVRVLMIIDSNYKKMLDVVSDGILSSFLNKGKALAKKMTDFVLEVEAI